LKNVRTSQRWGVP